jgi:hypothetical protein
MGSSNSKAKLVTGLVASCIVSCPFVFLQDVDPLIGDIA